MNHLINRTLKKFFVRKRQQIWDKYQRTIPANELFTDRWDKAAFLKFGKDTSIYDSSFVFGDVKVGKNTWIGPFTILDGSGGLEIGSNCSISAGVQIYTHDSMEWAISGGETEYAHAPTRIGNNCYIGPNTIVQKGIEIGDGTVIGANSYVNRSWPPNSKIAGSPAKSIG